MGRWDVMVYDELDSCMVVCWKVELSFRMEGALVVFATRRIEEITAV